MLEFFLKYYKTLLKCLAGQGYDFVVFDKFYAHYFHKIKKIVVMCHDVDRYSL